MLQPKPCQGLSWFCATLRSMRASRLLSMLMLLQTRGALSAPRLAELLQVSQRTVLRDIDHLSAAGVPVWAQPGRHGGIRLREGWRTQLTGLTAPEAQAVFLAGLPGPAAELGLGEAMALAQLKLLAALPEQARGDAQRMAGSFHLDATDWLRSAAPPPLLPAVAQAVWQRRRITMRYASWQRVSEPTVEPLGLVLKAGQWYLAGRAPSRRDPVPYRLAAIEKLQVLDEPFTPPPHFTLATWWRESAARFEAGLYTAVATLRVSEEGFARVTALGTQVARAAEDSARPCERDGWAEVEIPIESVAHATRELLRLGEHVEVLSPPALRAAVRDTALAVWQAHANQAASP
jgi:predicted DNA-binding transcriptional regulator YafY